MNVWLTLYRVAKAVFAVTVVVAAVMLFLPKIRQNQERLSRVKALEEENRILEGQIKQLQSRQDQFLSDPRYVERIAREELGKVKEGETVFRFSENRTNAFRVQP